MAGQRRRSTRRAGPAFRPRGNPGSSRQPAAKRRVTRQRVSPSRTGRSSVSRWSLTPNGSASATLGPWRA